MLELSTCTLLIWERILDQSQYQMSHLQNGFQDMRTEMQENIANSEHAFKQEAEQLMENEQEKECERLKYATTLANMRK